MCYLKYNMSDCVAIIGSGPVGVALSIKLKLDKPDLNVVVYEQRELRTRKQKVRLEPRSLPKYLEANKLETISSIENRWIDKAKSLGVLFINNTKITSTNLPLAKYVVLATGSKCNIRNELFGVPKNIHKPKTVVVCSYTTLAVPNPKLNKNQLLALMTIFGGIIHERVNTDSHEVTLFWEIAEDEAESTIKTITNQIKSYATNLIDLVTDGKEDTVPITDDQRLQYKHKIKVWLNYRNDGNISHDLHWSVYKSTMFSMDKFVTSINNSNDKNKDNDNNTTVYLIGDCAIGVPYFRSLQHGLEDVTKFTFNKKLYQLQMLTSASKESTVAMTKSTILDVTSIGLKINRFNPVKLVHIPVTDLRDYPGL